MTRIVITHGAMSGVKAHRGADEPLCEDCAEYHAWWLDMHRWGPLDLRPCGTVAAIRRHERRREPLDEACRKARYRRNQDRQPRRREQYRERRRRVVSPC